VQPAVLVGDVAVLDAEQVGADALGQRAGLPSPIVMVPSADLKPPIGVTTAAVPEPNASVIAPDAASAFSCSIEIRPSPASMPRSARPAAASRG
jgi:hypothetical protein